MIDYFSLYTSSENPGLIAVIYTLLFTFLLSSIIAIVYVFTTHKDERSNYFIQSIVLGSIAASVVVQAIGDSVAIGLGVLGALAIIRFRTNFRNPRNIIFLFAALAIGIACGVYGYIIAIVGTIGFGIAAILLQYSPMTGIHTIASNLRMTFTSNPTMHVEIEQFLKGKNIYFIAKLDRINAEGDQALEYRLFMKRKEVVSDLVFEIKNTFEVNSVRIEFEDLIENFD